MAGNPRNRNIRVADCGVGTRDHERVRHVVDQVVLARERPRRSSERPRASRERRSRVAAQPAALDEHVDLLHGQALVMPPSCALAARKAGMTMVANVAGLTTMDSRHVEEVLEVARAATGKERPRAREVCHSADRQRHVPSGGKAQIDRPARPDPECSCGLRAEQGGSPAERARRESDRRVVLAVAPVECEDADGARHRDSAGAQGPGRQVDEGQAVGRGHARNRRDPRPHLLERQETGDCSRGSARQALTARDASARPQGFRRYRAPGLGRGS